MAEMSAEEVIRVYSAIEEAGYKLYIEGGWGADALLGSQRQVHDDLDLIVDLQDREDLTNLMKTLGYGVNGNGDPESKRDFKSASEQKVTLAFVSFENASKPLRSFKNGTPRDYDPEDFTGTGCIKDKKVKCLSLKRQYKQYKNLRRRPSHLFEDAYYKKELKLLLDKRCRLKEQF